MTIAAVCGVLFFGCFTIGTRRFAMRHNWRPTGVAQFNGFHGQWPWQMTHPPLMRCRS